MRLALAALAFAGLAVGCGAQSADDDPSLDEVAAATRADPYRFEGSFETEGRADQFTAEVAGEIRKTRSESSDVEAWAGADGLLRKLDFTTSISEDGESGRMVSSTRFFDFGKPVEVEEPPASAVDRVPGSGPCREVAAPHSAEAVMKALRDAGFTLNTFCVGGETMIVAVPKQQPRARDRGTVCSVAPGPGPPKDVPGAAVAGNVACVTPAPAERATVRKLLDGL